jgi:starch synthase
LRARLRIPERTFVVLFVGRLSYHGKAHPLPLYLSLERCMKSSRVPICLLLAGWFANQSIRKQFTEAARMLCPSVPVVVADGRIPEVQRDVWHAADVFASPSDNIQETFGLTPVEAMAAGLPSVISDWNGYRDGPREGAEGFLVPSWLAPAGTGEEIARRHHVKLDDYDHYIANTGQFAAVEVAPMARAFETLISRPELRREMGERARRRAVSYDWSVIIPQYEELWTELAARRAVDAESARVRHSGSPTPHHADPFTLFAGYASQRLNGRTLVSLRPGTDAERMRERTSLFMNALARNLACDVDTIDAIFLELCDGRELRAADLLEAVDFADRRTALRTLVWLTKLDLVQLRNPDS